MESLEPYILTLESLAKSLVQDSAFIDKKLLVKAALNGELAYKLRELVPIALLQESGAFFTGEEMSREVVTSLPDTSSTCGTALDASCGGGNLLLTYARQLSLLPTLSQTLVNWGARLKGVDIHEEFVRVTRARIALLAAQRGIDEYGSQFLDKLPDLRLALPHIYNYDSLKFEWPEADTILLNPPFNLVYVPEECKWATGRVSQAALFISKCVESMGIGSVVRAILPDVLRSGSRYKRWRTYIATRASVEGIKVLGQFDSKTNVEVFLLSFTVGGPALKRSPNWVLPTHSDNEGIQIVGDLFNIGVGRVVPHRDAEEGPLYAYLDVSHLPPWKTILASTTYRKFSGGTFKTPFVAVRRTSRAKDAYRAVGTLVQSSILFQEEQVAVENHLIVLSPKSGKISDCELLMDILKSDKTNRWFNEYIRCRHLTVGSLQEMPLWESRNVVEAMPF